MENELLREAVANVNLSSSSVIQGRWSTYQERYAAGEYRALVFRDMIIDEMDQMSLGKVGKTVVADIGCGGGFDGDNRIQQEIARHAGEYIGIEPDKEIELLPIFTKAYRTTLEDAPIQAGSVDLAFAVMVLEHIDNPELFWKRIYQMLRPGGVFWGFTIDARHWFVHASLLFDRLGIKDKYLTALHGKRGEKRYENYGVYYRINHPEAVHAQTAAFSRSENASFQKIGQLAYYFPTGTRWIASAVDRLDRLRGKPGNVIAIRVER